MFARRLGPLLLSAALLPAAQAEDRKAPNAVEALRQEGYSVRTITPVFSELVMLSYPKGFAPAFENTRGISYIQESVLAGETVKNWSQMITLTGARGLASNPRVTPKIYAEGIAGGFREACPASFAAANLGPVRVGSNDAFAALVSCGVASRSGDPYSESMLLIVIKGTNDYYTVQWAERGAASTVPLKFDPTKWNDRLKRLSPIRLCPIVPGEQAPYASCAGRS